MFTANRGSSGTSLGVTLTGGLVLGGKVAVPFGDEPRKFCFVGSIGTLGRLSSIFRRTSPKFNAPRISPPAAVTSVKISLPMFTGFVVGSWADSKTAGHPES